MNREEKIEKIVQYLEDTMSVSEHIDFEKALQSDRELQDELERTRMSLMFADSMEQDAMEAQFGSWNKEVIEAEKSKSPSSIRIWPFLLLIPIAIGTYFLINNETGDEKIEERKKDKIEQSEIKIEEKTEAEIEMPKSKIEPNRESKTAPIRVVPKSKQPIAAVLSREQRALISSKILIIDGVRSNEMEKELLHPMWAKVEAARKLLIENRAKAAIELLHSVPSDDTYFPKSLELLGHAYLSSGQCLAAIPAFQNCLTRQPANPQVEYGLYLAYIGCGMEADVACVLLKEKILATKGHPFLEKVE